MEAWGYQQLPWPSISAFFAYGILLFFLDRVLGFTILSPAEILWNLLVSVSPSYLILEPAQRRELQSNPSRSQTFAVKSAALRTMLGLEGESALLQCLPATTQGLSLGISNTASREDTAHKVMSEMPSGLGNWDNSCYQNSVLQALSSLPSLRQWLEKSSLGPSSDEASTTEALQMLVTQLRDPSRNGTHIWTPAKLKNMSSWQQQDAQEYFSKIMDELDKDVKKAAQSHEQKWGLETLVQEAEDLRKVEAQHEDFGRNLSKSNDSPLQGWNAQRVACIQCGYSDGYSMIPFFCLTVPLGMSLAYDIQECLDEYTKREAIDGVECRRCTLLQAESKLKKVFNESTPPVMPKETPSLSNVISHTLSLPPELRIQIHERLQAIQAALDRDDYSDKTLKQACQIPANAYVSSTKTREAVIGRAPQSLVIHVNRSVFNELTGMQSKNHARVRYPLRLDLRPWMLEIGNSSEYYRLSSVITHKGAHENGHYICYKQHPHVPRANDVMKQIGGNVEEDQWYMLSDSDVFSVTEDEVMHPLTGGVFMLFYERMTGSALQREILAEALSIAISTPLPADEADDVDDEPGATPVLSAKEFGSHCAEVVKEDLAEESESPTVPPSEYSEPDTDITEFEQSDLSSQKEHQADIPAVAPQPLLRTAAPTDRMMEDSLRTSLRVMRV